MLSINVSLLQFFCYNQLDEKLSKMFIMMVVS